MVKLAEGNLTLTDVANVVFNSSKVELDASVKERVLKSFNFLKDFSKDKIIYGINTGFGPMAQYRIDDDKLHGLQLNLIRSHCSGMGETLSIQEARALVLARMNTLCQGYSGIHMDTITVLQALLNKEITPVIYRHGSVGASGDLVQLSHLALVLIGEGEVFFQGEKMLASKAFEIAGVTPMPIHLREGLALINGTSSMAGIMAVNTLNANKLVDLSARLSCLMNEIVNSYDDHYSEKLNGVKKHYGQHEIARLMRTLTKGSKRILCRTEHLYSRKVEEKIIDHKVQEYYSLRCVPQILGPIYDAVLSAKQVVEDEINSANDNPIIDVETQNVYHGGNFHGDYISYEADKLKIGITKLTMLAERQINYLMNPDLNNILPPFLNLGELGYNFGFQGIQFTATSTTAECQTLSNPMSIHSIPNNNDNQDVVSMGTNSASICRQVIENAFQVLTIQSYAILQAVTILDIETELSPKSQEFLKLVSSVVSPRIDDVPAFGDLKKLNEVLLNKLSEEIKLS